MIVPPDKSSRREGATGDEMDEVYESLANRRNYVVAVGKSKAFEQIGGLGETRPLLALGKTWNTLPWLT
jgi:hypothetical protein